tara:strand:+ start:2255 stop:2806 length:552 start_codon:yes stop_codon:yes gene_type:complete
MLPIQLFNYPNGKCGIYIFKSGYQSTSSIFNVKYSSIPNLRSVDSDEGKSVLLFPVRNPIERFASAVNTVRKNKKYSKHSVNELIEMLEQNTFRNLHFMDIATPLRNACFHFDDIHLYKFPEHYEQMLRDGEYNDEIFHKNKSKKKLILTDSQKERVAKYYSTDIKLFESIKEPGQKFHFLKI